MATRLDLIVPSETQHRKTNNLPVVVAARKEKSESPGAIGELEMDLSLCW